VLSLINIIAFKLKQHPANINGITFNNINTTKLNIFFKQKR